MAEGRTGAEGVTALAEADASVCEPLLQMNPGTSERSGPDQETYPPSRLLSIGTAAELGVPLEKVRGTLVAIAPVVGSARVVSAARSVGGAFGLELGTEDD